VDRAGRLLIAALAGLAGCAVPLVETQEQAAGRHVASCAAAGFATGTEGWRICLLLQAQNDRLADLEGRLRRLETTAYPAPFPPWPRGYRW
jgi:hypothetical protein